MSKGKHPTKRASNQTTTIAQPLSLSASLLLLGFFLAFSFLLYSPALDYDYVLDDVLVFTENQYVKEGFSGIKDIMCNDAFAGYFGEQKDLVQGSRYRPLSIVSFAIEYEMWGLNARVSHLINILLYGLTVFITFLMLRKLLNEGVGFKNIFLSTAFLSSLIYLCHAIHVEAVANVKGRDEIMAMLFCMLSFITSLKYIDSKKIIWLILLPIFYFLGLLSKENSITFLAIIPLGLYYFRDGFSKKNLIVGGILLTTTIGYLLFRNHVIGYLLTGELSKDLMNNPFAEMNILERYCTIFYTLLIYLKLIFIPHPLTHDYYPYHIPMMHITNWQVYLSIFLHLNIMYVMFIWRKKRKLVSFAIFFYIISMSIVSNLFVDVGTFMNERFAFVSSLSACIILVYFAKEVAKKYIGSNKAVLAGILGVIILLYGYKTIDRLPAWESALTLNREAIKVSKNSARANSFMSTALFNSYLKTTDQNEKIKLLTEAKPYADKAVEVHPTYFNGHKMRVGIASELFKIDRNLDNLLIAFKETLIHRPDIPFIKTFLEYVHRFEDQEKLKAFYKDVCINELMVKQQNYQWAGYYLNLAMQLDASDPQLNKALRKCKSVLSNN